MNLLTETIEKIKDSGKKIDDVLWVGSSDGEYAITWNKFAEISNREYDSGFGANEVNSSLVVVGKNWWLERGEYDGSEWWEYKELPKKATSAKECNTVFEINYSEQWL